MKRLCRLLILPLLATLGGCAGLSYVWQGLHGQMELLSRARPIDDLIDDAATSATMREKLSLARDIRAFAARQLALPDNRSYTRYSELGRPYLLWNVIATPALSLKPIVTCFPVAGCVAYRGYFSKADAGAFAASQREQGLDVYVAGVPAYSTLGWFDDPLPSTVLHYGELDLARLLFHELAHQVVYVSDDTTFNESFAVAVEEEGLARWVAHRGEAAKREQLARSQAQRAGFRDLIGRTRVRLGEVYAGAAGEPEKLAAKARILSAMQSEYQELRAAWGGFGGYDAWFAREQNNASLASVALYADQVPQFRRLLRACGEEMPRFFGAVRVLATEPRATRNGRLAVQDPSC